MNGMQKYPNLLAPYKLGSHLLKNRLIAAMGEPYNTHGPEEFPPDGLIAHYINKAKNGAALICIDEYLQRPYNRHIETNEEILRNRFEHPNPFNPDHGSHGGSGRMDFLNIVNGGCQNHFSELSEAIHFYGAKTVFGFQFMEPYPGYGVSYKPAGQNGPMPVWEWRPDEEEKEIPWELMDKFLDELVLLCTMLKECGFDGIYLHLNYRLTFLGKFLSPLTNWRTDEFGGSVENRARYPIMAMDRIKKRCGKDFIIMGSMNARDMEGSYTFEEMMQYANLFTGHMDILQIKCGRTLDESAPLGFHKERIPALKDGALIKKGAPGIPIAVNGGFEYPEDCEAAIVAGQTDLVSLSRAWITNPDYGLKVYEGRSKDIVPCLRCNACHISSYHKPWVSTCSVNPQWGFEHRIDMMTAPLDNKKKKVAVVGSGPAGMEAALVAAEKGHDVTLYEKASELGGLLRRISRISHKWPHRDFMNYMIRRIGESNVKVLLNTEATKEVLEKENYDVILAAIGANPIIPSIPGVDGKNVCTAVSILGNEDAVKGDVVIIGGGEVGVDTGLHLAELGHKVTVLEMENMLARTATPIHFYSVLMAECEKQENFHSVVNAHCTGIFPDKVTYVDIDGAEHTVNADTVVLAVGMAPKHEEGMKFYGTGSRLFLIGDCNRASDIQRAMRSAYGTAVII
ncbi:MAG: FAD-dependent oxidoreductase [Oscillospiraceae bacterium]|jgi:2,4-dienoyl-CoA reductase-like NADH-dependent reductase (Old Yellow Enzyme family)/thioredoxin reductase